MVARSRPRNRDIAERPADDARRAEDDAVETREVDEVLGLLAIAKIVRAGDERDSNRREADQNIVPGCDRDARVERDGAVR